MKGKKLLVVSLAALPLMVTACNGGAHDPSKDVKEREDYTSVYEQIGSKVNIAMVEEDEDTGLAYVTVEGTEYELGMDFLSMAMVYNTTPISGNAKYDTAEEIYNEWWKLYIQRWNYLMPEVPLYSNQYYDLFNPKLNGFVTSPYWGSADAINKTGSKDGKVILGSSTELSGLFRNAAWGVSSPAASNNDIANLTSGYSTVMSALNGAYAWNLWNATEGYGVLKEEPTSTINDDGTLTYTLEIVPGLKFSDGSEIKAKNYLVGLLANSTAVGVEAGGTGASGRTVVGYKEFAADKGEGTERTAFKGVKLLSDYKFSVTFIADYAGYYYSILNGGFSPDPLKLYLGDEQADWIKVNDKNEVYLDSAFYAKDGEGKYVQAAKIKANMNNTSASDIPYSGPFKVKTWDASKKQVTLERNNEYPGDAFRGKKYVADGVYSQIDEIAYVKVESETQVSMFKKGEVDVIAGITGGTDTKAALKLVADGVAKETHYDRAGYGKLGFRADFGPTMFAEVRRAIAYSINRPEFASTFTGGYGSVVDGPYYEGFSAFQAKKDEIKLNSYSPSSGAANLELEAGGWVYDKNGNEYKEGIRYKKLSGYEKTLANLTFKSNDGKYQTEYVNGEYYMPLVINWYGTQPNDVTDILVNKWQSLPTATSMIGMHITYTSCDFTVLLAELQLEEGYGWDGTQKLNAANFASSFSSAAYDYSFNWTLDPAMYDDYSVCYLRDEADFYSTYHTPNA